MRKHHDKNLKAKIAIEAIKNEKTIQELAAQYDVHPNQIAEWKKLLLEGASDLFERPNKKSEKERDAEQKVDQLLKTVGQLTIDNDFLKKKYRQLYGKEPF